MRPRRASSELEVTRFVRGQGAARPRPDAVATEEPLEIRLLDAHNSLALATLMRTPGEDFELVAGFLFSEGLIKSGRDIYEMSYCSGSPTPPTEGAVRPTRDYNVVTVRFREGIPPQASEAARLLTTHSGCGMCAKTSMSPEQMCETRLPQELLLDPRWLAQLPQQLREAQRQYRANGGVHGAALFALQGPLHSACEDVGRHNAVDKLIGREILKGRSPLFDDVETEWLLLLSGRAGFELVQKALKARIGVLVSLGAPTSLAVHWARQGNLVLLGFLSPDSFNVYAGGERLRLTAPWC